MLFLPIQQLWVIHYEPLDVSGAKMLIELAGLVSQFDLDPEILPSEGLPPQIARLSLGTSDGSKRLAIGSVSTTYTSSATQNIPVHPFVDPDLLYETVSKLGVKPLRFASVRKCVAIVEDPQEFLRGHFISEKAQSGPINRSSEIQIHNLKKYEPSGWPNGQVNSWVRLRSGHVSGVNVDNHGVLIDQDFNTPIENSESLDLENFSDFVAITSSELESTLAVYFSSDDVVWVREFSEL